MKKSFLILAVFFGFCCCSDEKDEIETTDQNINVTDYSQLYNYNVYINIENTTGNNIYLFCAGNKILNIPNNKKFSDIKKGYEVLQKGNADLSQEIFSTGYFSWYILDQNGKCLETGGVTEIYNKINFSN